MRLIQTCTPDGHPYRVTHTRCIDTINSPDDGHVAARNMYRIEINIHEKELCVRLVIYNGFSIPQYILSYFYYSIFDSQNIARLWSKSFGILLCILYMPQNGF